MQSTYSTLDNELDKEYQISTKSIRPVFTASAFFCVIGCILCVSSSFQLANNYSYLTGLQYAAIAMSIISIIFLISTFLSFRNTKFSQNLRVTLIIFTFIFLGASIGLLFGSQIYPILSTFCGYYIGYNGEIDGGYIVISLQTDSDYPSCSEMEGYQASVQDQIKLYSYLIIYDYCQLFYKQSISSCVSESSLTVESWASMFGFQLASLIVLFTALIFFLVTIGMMSQRLKVVKQKIAQQGINGQFNTFPPQSFQPQQQQFPQGQNQPIQAAIGQPISYQGQPISYQGYQPVPYQGQQNVLYQQQQQFPNQAYQGQSSPTNQYNQNPPPPPNYFPQPNGQFGQQQQNFI